MSRTWQVTACTLAALAGFAANSLLTRHAIDARTIDAVSFMSIRLLSGAVTLAWLASLRGERRDGSRASALALAGYALGFTLAYQHIPAGVGAFLLFGSVQATMIGWGAWQGERRRWTDWIALGLAVFGLWQLTAPGRGAAPHPVGAMLMIAAGVCWGIYSLQGRRAARPLAATAGNFTRTVPIALIAWAVAWALGPGAWGAPDVSGAAGGIGASGATGGVHLSVSGVALAALSGSVTSGVAYSLWYAALPHLSTWTAAIVQLCVPIVTAAAASLWLAESISARLAISAACILGGVLWSIVPRRPVK